MLNIEMEFSKGILFIRLEGELTKRTANTFEEKVLPTILVNGIRYAVVNMDKVDLLDEEGMKAIANLNEITTNNEGRTTVCSLSDTLKESTLEYKGTNPFYEEEDELSASRGVMKI